MIESKAPDGTAGISGPEIRRTVIAGSAIIGAFAASFLSWASLAPLDSAAIAQGVVSIDGKRKTVQHLEGGIIRDILVRDGDEVRAGQVLFRMDDTKARATLELLRSRYTVSSAIRSRLVAERDNAKAISFPRWLTERSAERQVAEIIRSQQNILRARRRTLACRKAILGQRSAQYAEEIKGLQGQIAAKTEQIKLVRAETADLEFLFKKGLARNSRMLALQRRASELEGNRNLHRAQIARARQSMTESRMRADELKTTMINEVVENLRAAEAERYDLKERLRAARDVLRRTEVRTTISGTVVGLAVFTSGGVAAPGDRLLDIVPSGKTLMVEVRIDPRDIDVVHRGLPANVRITAFNQRDQAPIGGTVESVSADLLIDQNTGESYYLARVVLNDGGLGAKFRASLYPGMPAEIMVVTDSRTFLGYLLEPLSRSINRAFRES